MKNTLDKELVEKLKKGDKVAFDKIFNRYAGKLFAFALKYLRSKEDSEGLVQNVFLKIWEKRKSLKSDTSFQSYIFTLAYNEICNIYRKRSHQKKFFENQLLQNYYTQFYISDNIDHKLTIEKIDKIITQLPEKQKDIFIKSRKKGLSSKQIAKELNISHKTVDNYISSTVKIIKSKLGKESVL